MPFTTLVSSTELEHNLDNPDWVIFDCRSHLTDHDAGLKAYQSGHIPNAIFCDLGKDLSSPITEQSGRHPLPDFDIFIEKLEKWGVERDQENPQKQTQVIAYDDVGGAFAVRLWWQLRTLGHHKVAVLDGGIPQWINENRALSTDIHAAQKKKFSASINNNTWLNTDQLVKNLGSKRYIVLDARTPERYRGESEPIDTIAGRIPDSLNRAFQLNLDDNGLFLPPEILREQFGPIIESTPNKSPENIVHLCGSGVTACHNMLAMEIAGYYGSKLYPGSWSEWIRDKSRPVATD